MLYGSSDVALAVIGGVATVGPRLPLSWLQGEVRERDDDRPNGCLVAVKQSSGLARAPWTRHIWEAINEKIRRQRFGTCFKMDFRLFAATREA